MARKMHARRGTNKKRGENRGAKVHGQWRNIEMGNEGPVRRSRGEEAGKRWRARRGLVTPGG